MVRVLLGRGVGVHFYGWLVDVCFSRIPMESSKFEEKKWRSRRKTLRRWRKNLLRFICVHTTHSKCPKSAVWPPLSPSLPHVLQFPCTYGLLTTAHSHVPLCFALLTLCFSPFIYLFILHFPRPETYKVKTRWFHFLKVQWRLVAPTYFSFSVKFILKQYLEYMYKTFAKNLKGYGWFEQKKINKK